MPYFLYIDRIKGDATEENHQGEIELTSVMFPGGSPGNTGPGHFKVQEVEVSKQHDSASTALFKASNSGEMFKFMILDMVRGNSTARMTMQLVALGPMSVNQGGVEIFNLNFETMTIEHL